VEVFERVENDLAARGAVIAGPTSSDHPVGEDELAQFRADAKGHCHGTALHCMVTTLLKAPFINATSC